MSDPTKQKYTERLTAYISKDMEKDVERVRSGALLDHGIKTDKSVIVRAALRVALLDYQARGVEGDFFKQITELEAL